MRSLNTALNQEVENSELANLALPGSLRGDTEKVGSHHVSKG